LRLSEINIYPIKSTRRIALQESEVPAAGLPWDRRWMLIDAGGGFVTARQHPRLALVETRIGEDCLHVSGPGCDALDVPLAAGVGELVSATLWKDRLDVPPVSAEADAWFSRYLGFSCRLVRMTDEIVRPVKAGYGRAGDRVSFADGFPLLVISEGSLADLNGRLAKPVSMRRFRPNLVVDGCEAFAEDRWRRIRVGAVEFEGVKACSRCVFTTIDPDTGEKDPDLEPLRTLGTYRRGEGGVFFGRNLIPRSPGRIHVGDPVEVLDVDSG
jgi:hypothetical protein